jgi:hypothetical protein
MSNHFISLNRGQNGSSYSDFVTGTASTAGADVELRVADGASLTKNDLHLMLLAFERFFENAQQAGPAGFVVTG